MDQRREFSPQGAGEAARYLYLSSSPGSQGGLTELQGGAVLRMDFMADAPYLVALALVELQGQRALPLTGKSQADSKP